MRTMNRNFRTFHAVGMVLIRLSWTQIIYFYITFFIISGKVRMYRQVKLQRRLEQYSEWRTKSASSQSEKKKEQKCGL